MSFDINIPKLQIYFYFLITVNYQDYGLGQSLFTLQDLCFFELLVMFFSAIFLHLYCIVISKSTVKNIKIFNMVHSSIFVKTKYNSYDLYFDIEKPLTLLSVN
jgi:hypothetical protein